MNRKALRRMLPLIVVALLLADCAKTTTTSGTPTAFAALRFTDTGALDTTFGGTGKGIVLTDIDPALFDFAIAAAVQPADNKILAGGSSGLAGEGVIALVRYNADGTPDTGFGTNGSGGIVRTPLTGVTASASAIAVQADNKIVVAALTFNPFTGDTGIALLRYNTNGTLDTTGFGAGNGFVTAAIGPGLPGDTCALALQGTNIIVAGATTNAINGSVVLYRYDASGTLDPTFGNTGSTATPLSGTAMSPALAFQSTGKIILVSGTAVDQVVLRYSANGILDATFGSAGIVTTDIGNTVNFANAVAVQADDKIVVAGHTNFSNFNSDISLVRYNADGTPDAGFGTSGNGIVTTDLGGVDGVFSIALQPQTLAGPKILVSGNISSDTSAQLALVRYNPDGSLDASFDGNGIATAPIAGPSNISSANAVVLQPGVGIVVVGYD